MINIVVMKLKCDFRDGKKVAYKQLLCPVNTNCFDYHFRPVLYQKGEYQTIKLNMLFAPASLILADRPSRPEA